MGQTAQSIPKVRYIVTHAAEPVPLFPIIDLADRWHRFK